MAITNFTSTPTSHLNIDNDAFEVETAGKSYSLTEVDDHTLRLEIQQGDKAWYDTSSLERSEIDGSSHQLWPKATPVAIEYLFMLEPGTATTSAWFVFGEIHNTDTEGFNVSTSPPFAMQLAPGDYFQVLGRYCPSNLSPSNEAGNLTLLTLWTASTPIVRGQWYDIKIQAGLLNTSQGYLDVWVNGTQVVNYGGPLGYGLDTYWMYGLYRDTEPKDTAAQFRDMTISPL